MSSTSQTYGVYMSDVATMNMQKMEKSYMIHTYIYICVYASTWDFSCVAARRP